MRTIIGAAALMPKPKRLRASRGDGRPAPDEADWHSQRRPRLEGEVILTLFKTSALKVAVVAAFCAVALTFVFDSGASAQVPTDCTPGDYRDGIGRFDDQPVPLVAQCLARQEGDGSYWAPLSLRQATVGSPSVVSSATIDVYQRVIRHEVKVLNTEANRRLLELRSRLAEFGIEQDVAGELETRRDPVYAPYLRINSGFDGSEPRSLPLATFDRGSNGQSWWGGAYTPPAEEEEVEESGDNLLGS